MSHQDGAGLGVCLELLLDATQRHRRARISQLASHALARLGQLCAQAWRAPRAMLDELELAVDVPERLLQQLTAALWFDVLAPQLGAHRGAGLLGGEQRPQLLQRSPRAAPSSRITSRSRSTSCSHVEAVAPRWSGWEPRAAARSPRSSGSCAGSSRRACHVADPQGCHGRAHSCVTAVPALVRALPPAAVALILALTLGGACWDSPARHSRERCCWAGSPSPGVLAWRAQQAHEGADQRRRREHPQGHVHVGDERRELLRGEALGDARRRPRTASPWGPQR